MTNSPVTKSKHWYVTAMLYHCAKHQDLFSAVQNSSATFHPTTWQRNVTNSLCRGAQHRAKKRTEEKKRKEKKSCWLVCSNHFERIKTATPRANSYSFHPVRFGEKRIRWRSRRPGVEGSESVFNLGNIYRAGFKTFTLVFCFSARRLQKQAETHKRANSKCRICTCKPQSLFFFFCRPIVQNSWHIKAL